MQKRTPKKIYRTSKHYYVDCEDGYSVLGIFIIYNEPSFWGWCDGLPGDAKETSWLDLLVVTGVSQGVIEEVVSNSMSTHEINEHIKNKHVSK